MSNWWIKDKKSPCGLRLVSYCKKRTLLAARKCAFDSTVVWIEGADIESPIENESRSGFGMVGGAINTNTGVQFTRDDLKKIVAQMPPRAILKVAGCNDLDIPKLKDDFNHKNSLIQIDYNQFEKSAP